MSLSLLSSISWDPTLPITHHLEEILALLARYQVIVVAGDTGSGKSTQLPKICWAAGLAERGLIGHTQPRRIAARSVAERVASELQVPLGDLVGYHVRFHDQYSKNTRIKLMTDGILLSEIQRDPLLKSYAVIILDEAHERSLSIDFLLGYLKTLVLKRRDLKVIITSATLDHTRFAEHFHKAPVVTVQGRTYPVDILYQPLLTGERDSEPLDQAVGRAITQLFKTHGPGDVLIFLSTEREIHELAQDLRAFDAKIEICKLFARLSLVAQQKIFHPKGGSFRVILSTNVAETSVTVPRIRYVIDAGMARISRYRPGTKVQSLPIEKISQASSNQRAGRCGRVGPGVCVRLYSREDFELRPLFTDPEILRTHLAGIILQMKASRLGDIEDFPFLDPPERQSVRDGYALLKELNALDPTGGLTPIGRTLARLPVDPRLGRIILMGHQKGCLYDVLVIVAQLSLQDPRERPVEQAAQADQVHAQFRHPCSDFLSDLCLWEKLCEAHQALSHRKFRQFCENHYLSIARVMEWLDLFADLKQRCIELNLPVSRQERFEFLSQEKSKNNKSNKNNKLDFLKDPHYTKIHQAILSGVLGHIGHWNPEKKHYTGARQLSFQLFPGSTLKKKPPAWMMGFALVETGERFMRHTAEIDVAWIEPLSHHLVKKTYRHPHFILTRGRVCAFEQVSVYGLVIVQKRLVPYGKIDPVEARRVFILEGLVKSELPESFLFWHHNQNVIAGLQKEGAKLRREDIALDDEALAAFYHTRLPLGIDSLALLSEFLSKTASQGVPEDQKILYLTEESARRTPVDAQKLARDFPDFLDVAGGKLMIHYQLTLGEPLDGATLQVPLARLLSLTPAQWGYLIPGFLPQKAEQLIRALPKAMRRQCLPISEVILDVLSQLTLPSPDSPFNIDFETQFREKLSSSLGIELDADVWMEVVYPMERVLHIALLSENGEILAHSDDLALLQSIWHQAAQKAWEREALAVSSKAVGQKLDQILRHFPEHPLPLSEQVNTHEGSAHAYWALEPVESSGVRCVLLPSLTLAKTRHQAGVRVLLALSCQESLKSLPRVLPDFQASSLLYSPFGSVSQWREGLIFLGLQMTFESDSAYWDIRSQEDFKNLLENKNLLLPHFRVLTQQLKHVFTHLQQVQKRLQTLRSQAQYREALLDIDAQLAGLFPQDFLRKIPRIRLARYEVYLSGIEIRCERLVQDVQKDQRVRAELQPFLKLDRQRLEEVVQAQYPVWLEELRISLFAQPLKTAMPISSARVRGWCGVEIDKI